MKRLWGVLMCVGVLGGCATQPPRWAGQMWQTQNRLYFTGSSSSCQTVSCAYENAYQQALGAIAQYLGSQISVHSVSRLDNQGSELEVETEIITRKIELEKVKVEEFNCIKQGKKQEGFISVSIGNKELLAARQKLKEQQEQLVRRHQKKLYVRGREPWVLALHTYLQQSGFSMCPTGQPLYVEQVQTSCKISRLQPVWVATAKIRIAFENKEVYLSAVGYGLTCEEAYEETRADAGRQITHWLEENI